jgi:hypothetical protein
MKGYVYRIQVAHKFYYGQTVHLKKRKQKHLSRLKVGKHKNQYMQRAWDKYDQFSFDVVATCEDADADLDALEQGYIDRYYDDPDCMNLARYVVPGRAREDKHNSMAQELERMLTEMNDKFPAEDGSDFELDVPKLVKVFRSMIENT